MVSEYKYLGILFTDNVNFNKARSCILKSANRAVGSSLKILNKLSLDNWSDVPMIFDVLVRSILMYGVEVWGLFDDSRIEKVQSSFFKRILYLPRNTPSYALRLEIGRVPIQVKMFDMLLRWLNRIALMDHDRFPRKCFLRLCELVSTNPEYKCNWILQIKPFFDCCDLTDIWSSLVHLDLLDTVQSTHDFFSRVWADDVRRGIESSSLKIFPFLKARPSCSPAPYLVGDIKLQCKRTIAQFRLLNTYQGTFYLNYSKISTRADYCPCCYQRIDDLLLHMVGDCTFFCEHRGHLLSHTDSNDSD